MLIRVPSLIVAGALAAGLFLGPAAAQTDGPPRRSLEELLAEERAAAQREVELLRPRVEGLLTSLRSLGSSKSGDSRVSKILDELRSLGSPGAVLLVEALDPGPGAPKGDLFLAGHVMNVLEDLPTTAITQRLLEMSLAGTERGRAGALRVLGATGDPRRVGAHLAKVYHEDQAMRSAALSALCLCGGPEADEVLRGVIHAKGDELGEALAALTEAFDRGRRPTPSQLAFLRELLAADAVRDHIDSVIAFCRAAPEGTFGEPDTALFVALCADRNVDRGARIRLLGALPDLGTPWERNLNKLLERSAKSSFEDLRNATLVCLTRFGDKGARKDLLDPYKDAIRDERKEPAPLEARGAVLIEIQDYEEAITDYKKALKLYEELEKSPYASNGAHIGLARAFVLSGAVREGAKVLEDSALSTVQLRGLAEDPDFAALVADDRYRSVLRLKE
ncbi:MAG: tetratricopeptide repeat protein [Planctomycetota bacterium]|nr:tetratricopeptide repeat protein [Planctomycetota bacterium]